MCASADYDQFVYSNVFSYSNEFIEWTHWCQSSDKTLEFKI